MEATKLWCPIVIAVAYTTLIASRPCGVEPRLRLAEHATKTSKVEMRLRIVFILGTTTFFNPTRLLFANTSTIAQIRLAQNAKWPLLERVRMVSM
jgi:hypothetical protein